MNQRNTPLADALAGKRDVVAFDVPGHRGRMDALKNYFGAHCLGLDVNSRPELDMLYHPDSVIAEAERLAAEAFGARDCFFMVGGTTSAVQSMILCACREGDVILLPRNVHSSVINGIILCGAVPVYIKPGLSDSLGIPLGISTEDVAAEIAAHPEAKAILVNHPTYYGICSDLKKIVEIAHAAGIKVLADEAHGTHFAFSNRLPASAMACGADYSAVSIHKTGGALTQSSCLLVGEGGVDRSEVQSIINLTLTTSASYLLMASIDIARSVLATEGEELFGKLVAKVSQTRAAINALGGYRTLGRESVDGKYVFDLDETKLVVNGCNLGYAGIELYRKLLEEYHIQAEFGDVSNLLLLPSPWDESDALQKVRTAFEKIAKEDDRAPTSYRYEYIPPQPAISPRKAYFAPKYSCPLDATCGKISAEYVMCYPPGIPILAPGEYVTSEVIEYIEYAVAKGLHITGMSGQNELKVLKG